MRKLFLTSLFALAVGIGTAQAQTVMKVRPPKVQVEHRGARPSREQGSVVGYHQGNGTSYAW